NARALIHRHDGPAPMHVHPAVKPAALLAAAVLSVAAAQGRESLEDRYVRVRDSVTRQLATLTNEDARHVEDDRSLAELTDRPRDVVGPVRIGGFAGDGEINLETLLESEPGFNQLDGLNWMGQNDEELFVTTSGLLRRYAVTNRLPVDLRALSRD